MDVNVRWQDEARGWMMIIIIWKASALGPYEYGYAEVLPEDLNAFIRLPRHWQWLG